MEIPDEEHQQSLDKENVEAAASQPDGIPLEIALGMLEQQVKDFKESSRYQDYSRAVGELPFLSKEERALLLQRNPKATHVAPAEVWEKKFKRHVRPGEKGVELPIPIMREVTIKRPHRDEAGEIVRDRYGKVQMETFWKDVPISPTTTFYDISQLTRKPFVDIMHATLYGRVKNFKTLKRAIERAFPDVLQPQEYLGAEILKADTKYIDWKLTKDTMRARSLLHKAAHAALYKEGASHLDTYTKEMEAESLTLVVGEYYGIDFTWACLPCITVWLNSQLLPDLHASLPRIQQASKKLTTAIDTELVKMQEERKMAIQQIIEARRAIHLKRLEDLKAKQKIAAQRATDLEHPEDRKLKGVRVKRLRRWGELKMNTAVQDLEGDAANFAQLKVCSDYRAAMEKMPSYGAEYYGTIFQQNPYALHVAPAEIWEKEFGRTVLPGEKGIEIPAAALREAEQKGASDRSSLGADEKPTGKRPVKEKTALVYDIFQTKGKKFPEIVPRQFKFVPYINNLSAANISMLEQAIQQAFPNITLSFKNPTTKQEVADRTYIVLPKMKERMVIRALLHEAAHDVLHTGKAQNLETRTKEVQADSLAFVVGQYYSLNLSECVFPYIAACSSSPEAPELHQFLPQIQEHAKEMALRIDTEIEKIQAKSKQQTIGSEAQTTAPESEKRLSIQEQLAAAQAKAEQSRGSDAAKPSPGKDPER